jgi:NAD-dependent SIR2 family protein deacetylase
MGDNMKLRNKAMLRSGSFAEQVLAQQEDRNEESSDHVAFFLGAGASIQAGVPDTFSFVADFVASLNKDQRESVERIVGILQEWGDKQPQPRKVDIELLLEALQTLSSKEQEVLIPFIENPQLKISNINPSVLLTLLQNFIKEKVIVEIDKIIYLEHLRAFIQDYSPLDIYSANYDTCIELFCSEHKLHYKDGFDEAWNPKVFDDENIDIRLFKIHGSIMWYQSDRGRFLKIPLRTDDDMVELITKERAKGLMLYPAQKFEYVEPLFELLMEMKKRLDRCKILFVVGYSFRDDHVRRIFWDIARKNKEFRIVLIGPDSWKIYQERLKYYEDRKTLSWLDGKIVCLPYKFESVLPALKTNFLRDIRNSNALINDQNANEIAGHPTEWQRCLVSTAYCGDIEQLSLILKKINKDQIESIAAPVFLDTILC